MGPDGPIGIFDSGVGGLSVLRHIHRALPQENLLYFADSGFAPYGDKPEADVLARSLQIAEFLINRGAKALVVACNTATAIAIAELRMRYPHLPLIGIEPGLKPAAEQTGTKIVGVLATQRTLSSKKFAQLHERVATETHTRFLLQPCAGLASQIEKGELDSATTASLVRQYVAPLIAHGADILVLGCTHYPFIRSLIESYIRQLDTRPVLILDTGLPVTRQLISLLTKGGLQRTGPGSGSITAFTSGREPALAHAFADLLQLTPLITSVPLILPAQDASASATRCTEKQKARP